MKQCLIVLFVLLNISFAKSQNNLQNNSILKLANEFVNPPVSARPKALWPWINGNVSLPQITFELEEAKRKGMGGFDIWDIGTSLDPYKVIPSGPPFLSKESVQAIAYTINEADRLDLEIGLNFSSSWNAGGSWVKPEHGAMGLFRRDTIIEGPQNFSSYISFPQISETSSDSQSKIKKDLKTGLPVFYKEVVLLAHVFTSDSLIKDHSIILLSENFKDNHLQWNVPKGKWRIVRYVCAPTGQQLVLPSTASNGLMLDHFSGDAQKANLNYIFSQLLPIVGPLKNRSLKYLNADSYEVNSAVWTPNLPEEFLKRNKYNLENFLPILDGFKIKSDEISQRFKYDFTKTISDLIIKNHYELGRAICEEKGIGFVAEAGGPGQPFHNVPFEDLKALGALTIPRGEFWNKHEKQELLQIVKGIASASHIYNQKYVEAESFTSVWLWQEGPSELKPLADKAMCEGLNRFVYHTFPHSPPESGFPGWVYNFGTLINTTNGWWPKSKPFHEYLSRCSYLLQQGNFVGDIAYYYGDKAPNFVSPTEIKKKIGFGYDYDVVNTDVILNKMSVKDGRIYLPHGQFYEVLVLPDEVSINLDVLKKLEKLVFDGAIVLGKKPQKSSGLNNYKQNDIEVKELSNKLWANCDGINVKERFFGKGKIVSGKTINEVLSDKGVIADLQSDIDSLDFIHRKTKENEIYFFRNVKKTNVVGKISFRVTGMIPTIWNPENGEIQEITYHQNNNKQITIPISLFKDGSCFIVFSKSKIKDLKMPNVKLEKNLNLPHFSNFAANNKMKTKINLNNSWYLSFDQKIGTIARDTMNILIPLNESHKNAVKYYSGNVVYKTNFILSPNQLETNTKIVLDLGQVKEIAEIYLNGNRLGVSWHYPYKIDITSACVEGDNFLQIEVVNSINNRLIGDSKNPEVYRKTKTNITKLPNAWMVPFSNAELIPAGLIGPVQIEFYEK
jgi:hypothetical protein